VAKNSYVYIVSQLKLALCGKAVAFFPKGKIPLNDIASIFLFGLIRRRSRLF